MAKKIINERCPLATECERTKCEFINHELDCAYYLSNGWGESSIPDQEERRNERERIRAEEIEEMEIDALPDDDDGFAPEATYKMPDTKLMMLPLSLLYPHPDNPRKDLGDLTELAESIKANGVLQNLTVIKGHYDKNGEMLDGGYTVIIGHRRTAAAKLAGIDSVPCALAVMDKNEQISTMLTENMQRTDLTVYEQAKAFQQLSLDLGMSVEAIAKKSGFSETTVRRRTKLAELDEKSFKKACERGATLFDFAELDKLEDPAAKQKCLDVIGTSNFKNVLADALAEQKFRKRVAEIKVELGEFATEITEEEKKELGLDYTNYIREFNRWNFDSGKVKPDDAEAAKYYFFVDEKNITLFRETDEKQQAENEEREARRRAYEELEEQFDDIADRHLSLRMDFVKDLSNAACKKVYQSIAARLVQNMADMNKTYYAQTKLDVDVFNYVMDTDVKTNGRADNDYSVLPEVTEAAGETPEKMLFCACYASLEKNNNRYFRSVWKNGGSAIEHSGDAKLDAVYDLLRLAGYEMSDEEIAMRDGTHELFAQDAEKEDTNDE